MRHTSVKDRTTKIQKIKNMYKRGVCITYWWYRFKWNYFPILNIVNSAPLHVDIETTDACNLKCKMCIHGVEGIKDKGFINPELAYKAINECAKIGVYSIKFNFRGEPLLHKNLVDFVRYAKKKGLLEVQFNTNGLPIKEKKIEELINSGLDRIIFSVDGATKETYEKIRIGGNYNRLIRNIETFLTIKEKKRLSKPYIRVQMVKCYNAENEIKQFIDLWSKKRVDNISIIEKQDRHSKDGCPLKNGKKPTGRSFCEQPWQRLNVNRDGKVLMCCGDWNRKTIIGDLNKQSLKEIWKNEKMERLRNKIKKGLLDEIPACKTCFRTVTYRWD